MSIDQMIAAMRINSSNPIALVNFINRFNLSKQYFAYFGQTEEVSKYLITKLRKQYRDIGYSIRIRLSYSIIELIRLDNNLSCIIYLNDAFNYNNSSHLNMAIYNTLIKLHDQLREIENYIKLNKDYWDETESRFISLAKKFGHENGCNIDEDGCLTVTDFIEDTKVNGIIDAQMLFNSVCKEIDDSGFEKDKITFSLGFNYNKLRSELRLDLM